MKICWVNWVEPRDFEISPHVGLAWGFLFPTPAQNGEPAPQIGTHQPYLSFDSAASSAGEYTMSPKSSKSKVDPERRAQIEREWANMQANAELLRPRSPIGQSAQSVKQPPSNSSAPNDQVSWCAG